VPNDSTGNPQLLLRLPQEIFLPLMRQAKKTKTSAQSLIVEIVAAHYGVTAPAPKRGKPKSRA